MEKDVVYSPFGLEPVKPDSYGPLPDKEKKITSKESSAQKNTIEPKLSPFDEAKVKCKELGFRASTDRFGNCVLTLTK